MSAPEITVRRLVTFSRAWWQATMLIGRYRFDVSTADHVLTGYAFTRRGAFRKARRKYRRETATPEEWSEPV